MRPLLEDLLSSLKNPYAVAALEYLKEGQGKVPGKGYIDNAKLTDHHAIIPTREPPSSLAPDARQAYLYGLVVARFVAIFFPDQLVEETTIRLDLSGHVFLASGKRQIATGWRVIDPPRQQEEGESAADLPALRQEPALLSEVEGLSKGQHIAVASLEIIDKETTPPRPYTDASLLSAMKNAGRSLADEAQAEALKESSGLGTSATRASVIEALLGRGYVMRKGKTLVPTDKGRGLIAAVPQPLRSPEMTAVWEQQLGDIEAGRGSASGFLDGIAGFVQGMLSQVEASSVNVPSGRNGAVKSIGLCPVCGESVIETGKAYGCSAWRDTGCAFKVWKVKSGKKLTASQVKALLTGGHTAPIKGFKSKAGKPFTAALKLNTDHEVVFDFGER